MIKEPLKPNREGIGLPKKKSDEDIVSSCTESKPIRIILDKPLSMKIASGIWIFVKIVFFVLIISLLIGGSDYQKNEQSVEKTYMNAYFREVPKVETAKELAVIPIYGEIMDYTGETFPSSYQSISEDIIFLMSEAASDPNVEAIMLRIDSPGGTVLASEKIAHYVLEIRRKKPIYALLEGSATSGGYYVASLADKIYAYPSTLTGNIGILMILPDLQSLFNKLGIEMRTFTSGEFKDMGSPFREMTEEEKEMINALVAESYDAFVRTVSSGRNMTEDAVRKLADGRIYSGLQAKENGLVDDTVLSFADAVEKIRSDRKIEKLQPVLYEIPYSPWEAFFMNALGSKISLDSLAELMGIKAFQRSPRFWAK